MAGRLHGKVALVTGAGSGIGAACVKAFAAEGAKVLATDIDDAAVAVTVAGLGDCAFSMAHDVASEAQWQAAIAEAVSRFGGLNLLVNNAGLARGAKITDVSLEDWRFQFAVNVEGVFLGTKHAIPAMVASGCGSIINISSVDGFMGAPLRTPYCATKGAVAGFTKAVAMECCEFGEPVRVNSVHPGPVATNIFASALPHSDPAMVEAMGGPEGIAGYYLRNTPMTRFAMPDEIAMACVYLGSDESAFMTGSQLVIDGGFTSGKLINQRMPAGM